MKKTITDVICNACKEVFDHKYIKHLPGIYFCPFCCSIGNIKYIKKK